MTSPFQVAEEVVLRGTDWRPRFKLTDADGNPLNLTVGSVTVVLRLKPPSGAVITRSSAVAGQSSWFTNGTDGEIIFNFTAAETLAFVLGKFTVEIVYTDTSSTPVTKRVPGRGYVLVEDAVTSPI